MKDFTAAFPSAKVWVCTGQWSWPVNLPLNFRCNGIIGKVGHYSTSSIAMTYLVSIAIWFTISFVVQCVYVRTTCHGVAR
jgi:Domain of unknown function (DUF4336)